MGLIAKGQTKKLVARQEMAWQAPRDVPDWLSAPELLYLAGVGMLTVAAKYSDCSSVRVQRVKNGFALDSGSWNMQIAGNPGSGVVVNVARYKTRDDALVDKKAVVRSREWLAGALGAGARIRVQAGLPDFANLVAPMVLPSFLGLTKSDLDGDMLPPMPACFADGAELPFPADASEALAAAMRSCRGTVKPRGDEIAAIETSVWLDENPGRLVLRLVDGEAHLGVSCPGLAGLSDIGAGRLFRSTMCALRELSAALEEAPPIKAAVDAFRDTCAAPAKAADRVTSLVPLWTHEIASPAMPVHEGTDIPVGLVATSADPLIFAQVLSAQRALLVRQRAKNPGLTRKALLTNPKYSTRRPAVFATSEGRIAPYLRYVETVESDADVLWSTRGKDRWFWQAAWMRCAPDEQGRHRTLLLADGLSVACDARVLSYGTELLTLFRAWAATVCAADHDVHVQTLFVQTPKIG